MDCDMPLGFNQATRDPTSHRQNQAHPKCALTDPSDQHPNQDRLSLKVCDGMKKTKKLKDFNVVSI